MIKIPSQEHRKWSEAQLEDMFNEMLIKRMLRFANRINDYQANIHNWPKGVVESLRQEFKEL